MNPRPRSTLLLSTVFWSVLSSASAQAQLGATEGEWRYYAADAGNTKYAPLDLINPSNVADLRIAWRWRSHDYVLKKENPDLRVSSNFQTTPLMIRGVLYATTSLGLAVAIDPETGETLWVHDPTRHGAPRNRGSTNRGLAYWTDGEMERLIFVSGSGLIAIDRATGEPCADFGEGGRVDLKAGIPRLRRFYWPSVPVICRDVVVVGMAMNDAPRNKEMPPGDVRGYDVRSGELRWTFHVIPREGEYGIETWEEDSWRYSGNANPWSLLSADEELGYVYLPLTSATNDQYGGHRPGDNLFSESLVCIEAETGRRVWHFQTTHHGLWDFDLPAAPVLCDITVQGRRIKAVAQVTKQAFCFVFDRVTGEPIWPIEEREVARSSVPGEVTSPTQPFPTRPPPFDRQGVSIDDLIDFTPELRAEAIEIIGQYVYGPLFTPPSIASEEPGATRGTIQLPGSVGGANWGGAAFDPETGVLYVPSATGAMVDDLHPADPDRSNFDYVRGRRPFVRGPRGLPLFKPPYGRITAIDLNHGKHLWMVPNGEGPRRHPLLEHLDLPPLGQPGRSAPLLTKRLLFAGEGAPNMIRFPPGGGGKMFRAFDKSTGEVLWETELPAGTTGAPMTYKSGGKQYIVVAIGGRGEQEHPGELVALSLPD